jgi:hypothetical protein
MQLLEIFDSEDYEGHKTEKDDNTVLKLSDIRKTKLTLAQLNRLRIMNDVHALEHEEKLESVRNQYKLPAAEMPPM